MERILITGVTGFLGSALLDAVMLQNVPVVLLGGKSHDKCQQFAKFYQCPERIENLDFRRPDAIAQSVAGRGGPPRAIIHVAAISDAGYCENHPEEAMAVNAGSVTQLIETFPNVPIIFVSTDLVFDGCDEAPQGGFTEDGLAQPRSAYARSKHAGELRTLTTANGLVVRTSLLVGRQLDRWGGFVGWMERTLSAGREVSLFYDEFRTPIWAADVALALIKLAEQVGRLDLGDRRIIHLAGSERLSRVDFGKTICQTLGYSQQLLKPVSRASVSLNPQRPHDVSLNHAIASETLGFSPHSIAVALQQCKQEQSNFKSRG